MNIFHLTGNKGWSFKGFTLEKRFNISIKSQAAIAIRRDGSYSHQVYLFQVNIKIWACQGRNNEKKREKGNYHRFEIYPFFLFTRSSLFWLLLI